MVSRINWLARVLLTWILSSVVFSKRIINQLKAENEQGSVIYVMKNRSLIDYIYFNLVFLREGIPLVRVANDLNAWQIRPFLKIIPAWLRGHRAFPDDSVCLRSAAQEGVPTTLFLSRPTRDEIKESDFSLPHLQTLVELQRSNPTLILRIVPKLLVWDKRPDDENPSIIDTMFGSRQRPGLLRGLIHVALNWWRSFVNFGAPVVVIGETIILSDFIAPNTDLNAHLVASELRDVLRRTLNQKNE